MEGSSRSKPHQTPKEDAAMLRIQTTNLSPDQQQRLHPDFLANEQGYVDYIIPQLARCPRCRSEVHEKTLVEVVGG